MHLDLQNVVNHFTPMSAERTPYQQLRDRNHTMNQNYASVGFCKGEGDCCEPNLLILEQDMKVIKSAVKNGEIGSEIVARAKVRASDPNLQNCPFLSDDKRCAIYPFRPLVCMQYGNAGYPMDAEKQIDEEKLESIQRGEFELGDTISVRELGVFACESCAKEICGTDIPLEVVQLSTITRDVIHEVMSDGNTYKAMKGFITQDL